MNDLPWRIAIAIVGIPLLVFTILKGGLYFFMLIGVISVLGQWELYRMLKEKEIFAQKGIGILLGLTTLYGMVYGFTPPVLSLALLAILILFSIEMFRTTGSANLNIAGTLFGVVYPVVFLAILVLLRMNPYQTFINDNTGSSGAMLLTIFVAVWICDTAAYFIGMRWGRHRLLERVSPKKSREGAIAGLIGAIATFLVARALQILPISVVQALIAGIIVGVVGQMGDLVESWFKRDVQVKDSSGLLPGHGGILDRFDSVMFIAPAFLIVYLLWGYCV